jgi:hypothetical protein
MQWNWGEFVKVETFRSGKRLPLRHRMVDIQQHLERQSVKEMLELVGVNNAAKSAIFYSGMKCIQAA